MQEESSHRRHDLTLRDVAAVTRAAKEKEPLSPAAATLLETLPIQYHPYLTARRFPHVINALAEVWSEPNEFLRRSRSYLIKTGRPRRGFPPEIFFEILQLVVFNGSLQTLALFDASLNLDQG